MRNAAALDQPVADARMSIRQRPLFQDEHRLVIPGFDDPDSLKLGKRDCAPAAKRGLRFIDR